MKAFATVFPVFLMIVLGFLARKHSWITQEQNEGVKKIIFSLLFPVMIFDAIFTSTLSINLIRRLIYLEIIWFLLYLAGKFCIHHVHSSFEKETDIEKLEPYLLMTSEGGSVCLPLYITLMGSANVLNVVAFDVAGILMNFVFVPLLVSHEAASSMKASEILKKVFTSSFVIAVILGVIANLTGLYAMISNTVIGDLYTNTVDTLTGPIASLILFTLGYDLKITKGMIGPLTKMVIMRILAGLVIISGFFIFFRDLMVTTAFRTAVLLYFMCPPGFPLPLQLKPLCRDERAEHFLASFMPLFMIITLIVYTILAAGIF